MGWSWSSPIMKPKETIKVGDLVLDTTDNKIGICVTGNIEEKYVYKEGAWGAMWIRSECLEKKMPAKTVLTIVQE